MKLHVGFTGTQDGMSQNQLDELREILRDFLTVPGIQYTDFYFHHGQCIGADEQAARIAKELGYFIVSHPPTNTSKMSLFPADETRGARPYLVRNRDIVDESAILIAGPKTNEERRRSGTWSTVRYAREQHLSEPFILTR